MRNKRRDWIEADLDGLDTHCRNKILYGNIDTFLKKCLKIEDLDFHFTKFDHIYPDSIKVKKIGYRFEIYLPYNLNAELLNDSEIDRMEERVRFEFDNCGAIDAENGLVINNPNQEIVSKLVLSLFIIKRLHSLLKENKVNEAFVFFMDIFDEHYYGVSLV